MGHVSVDTAHAEHLVAHPLGLQDIPDAQVKPGLVTMAKAVRREPLAQRQPAGDRWRVGGGSAGSAPDPGQRSPRGLWLIRWPSWRSGIICAQAGHRPLPALPASRRGPVNRSAAHAPQRVPATSRRLRQPRRPPLPNHRGGGGLHR